VATLVHVKQLELQLLQAFEAFKYYDERHDAHYKGEGP